jgi:hypothetical protein
VGAIRDIGATGNGRRTLGGELPAPAEPVVVLLDLAGHLDIVRELADGSVGE